MTRNLKDRNKEMAEIQIDVINHLAKADPLALIDGAELAYHTKIGEIADRIVGAENLRAVLLAGPSGSGKTTTANLLCDAIRERGEDATVLSLDDFYRSADDVNYPRTEDGERDFECPEALHTEDLKATLENITEGRAFLSPKYDFKVGARVLSEMHPAMPDGCVIIEGLHALNPGISENLPKDKIIKLFVSVSTNIEKDGKRIISGRKIRFCRRLVRDSIYRASDAKRTLSMWENVLLGEDKYLYPYKHTADIAFDTFHGFELGVMHDRAVALLTVPAVESNPYADIIIAALRKVEPIDEALVPRDSLLREFISGGIYHDIYK